MVMKANDFPPAIAFHGHYLIKNQETKIGLKSRNTRGGVRPLDSSFETYSSCTRRHDMQACKIV